MKYLSLYRKYRPKAFADVVGQENIVKILKNAIINNKVANAYLFTGIRGTGKTSIAKIFSNAINCLHNNNGDVCLKCDVCKKFNENKVVDLIELDAASNNGVDEIRNIIDKVNFLPAELSKKIYIIDEAHMLTINAWNALLKTIEEPPAHVIFIFATTEAHKIPETIISRCQCFRFNKITKIKIIELLKKICLKENISFEQEAIETIAENANGSIRDSLSILEQVATFTNNNIKNIDVFKIYGLLSNREIVDFLSNLSNHEFKIITKKIRDFYEQGINFSNFCNTILNYLSDCLIWLKTKDSSLFLKANLDQIKQINIQSDDQIVQLIDLWQEIYFKTNTPTDIFTIINAACLKSINLIKKDDANIQRLKNHETNINHFHDLSKLSINNSFYSIKINKHLNIEQKTNSHHAENTVKKYTKDELLFMCVANKNKNNINVWTTFIDHIKQNNSNHFLNDFKSVKKVFCASNNIVVLAFENEIDANLASKKSETREILYKCCQFFKTPFYIVCMTTSEINQKKHEIVQKMKMQIPEPDVSYLRNILDEDNSIQQIAYNTIWKKIIGEKNNEDN